MNEQELIIGRFITHVVSGPAVVTDCSGWDTLGEEITYGQFVTDVVSGPAVLQNQPAARLQLAFEVEAGVDPEVVFARLPSILELVRGCGFAWARATPTRGPGRIAIQFVPTTEDAVERLPWLKETLTPVLADIREVTKPEWSDVPASKV